MLCIKVYRKTSVGEAHRNKTRFDRENHEIQKATKQKPRSPKLDRNRPESGPPNLLYGPVGPSQHPLTSGHLPRDYVIFSFLNPADSHRKNLALLRALSRMDLDPCRKFSPLYKHASASPIAIPSKPSPPNNSEALLLSSSHGQQANHPLWD